MHFYADVLFISYLPFANKINFKIADKPEITSHRESEDIKEGGNVTFSCNSTANPLPTTSWTKDESPINNNSRISFSVVKRVLTITKVNRKDREKTIISPSFCKNCTEHLPKICAKMFVQEFKQPVV